MAEDSDDSDYLSKTFSMVEQSIQEEDFKRAGYNTTVGYTVEESSEYSEDDEVIDASFEEPSVCITNSNITHLNGKSNNIKSRAKRMDSSNDESSDEVVSADGRHKNNNITNGNGKGNKLKSRANRIDSSDDESSEEVESAAGRKNNASISERVLHRRHKPIIDSDSSDEETEPPRIASSSEDDGSADRSDELLPNKSISSANVKLDSHRKEHITHRRRGPVIDSDTSEEDTEPQLIESSSEDDAVSSKAEVRQADRSADVTKLLSDSLHIDLTESTDEDNGGKGDASSVPRRVGPPSVKHDMSLVPRRVEPPSVKHDISPVPRRVEPPSVKHDISPVPRRVEPPSVKRDALSLPLKVEALGSIQRPSLQAPPTGTSASSGATQASGLTNYFNMAFDNQKRSFEFKINAKRNEMDQVKRAMSSVNLRDLPDGGSKMMARASHLHSELRTLEQELATLASRHNATTDAFRPPANPVNPTKPSALWKNLKQTNDIQHGLGAKAMENHLAERALTLDALHTLHKSIKTCPGEETFSEDPSSLRSSVQLMPHQKQALAWLAWREQQKPSGGILADDMGLGKTLTMISLVLKQMEDGAAGDDDDDDDDDEDKPKNWLSKSKHKSVKGGTLVVCPASLLSQWQGEVKARVKAGVLDVEVHHGTSRETKPHRLARKDFVITTYAIVRTEGQRKGALHQVRWERIILDEAHVVRNYKSQTSIAVVALQAKHRWALTGTPIHNKELDLYALIKFLRCTPFDELTVWRRWVDNKRENGMQRLNTLLNSMMLRRTKELLQAKKALNCLPTKELHEIEVKLHSAEMAVYEKILEYSRNLFSQFLNQRAEKEAVANGTSASYQPVNFKNMKQSENPFDPKSKLGVLVNRYTSMEDVKSHQILVLLLRLRQICCHTGLIKAMLDEEEAIGEDGIEDTSGVDVDLLDQISKMSLGDKKNKDDEAGDEADDEADDVTKILSIKNEVFDMDRVSSKIEAVFKVLDERVLSTSDKAVVVSQWASMLHIMRDQLVAKGVRIVLLTGAVAVKDRMPIIEEFNQVGRGPQVMLLSLTAGGVGLNLIGGNHLFLCDLHWNPQLEAQACDRIYRVGQKKGVHIYKFVCESTIEQRIKALQDQKMQIAVNVLTGARATSANKLSMNDLKMLFEIA